MCTTGKGITSACGWTPVKKITSYVLGGMAGLALIVGLAFWYFCWRDPTRKPKKALRKKHPDDPFDKPTSGNMMPDYNARATTDWAAPSWEARHDYACDG
jgi:hypothetical protein